MAMFTFYGDESYGTEDAYSVAGYISTVEQWEELVREWREFARDEGFTVLHKKLLEHNVAGSEFEWPNLTFTEKQAKKKRINQRACGIILRRVIAGFSCSVVKSHWENFDKSPWTEALGECFYAAGGINVMRLVAVWVDDFNRRGIPIRFVFESGADGRDELEKILRKNLKTAKATPNAPDNIFEFSGYSFEDKKDPNFVPLQTADLLAYETYRQMGNRMLGEIKKDRYGNEIPVRGALSCVLQDGSQYGQYHFLPYNRRPTPHYGHYFTRDYLKGMLKFMNDTGARPLYSEPLIVPATEDQSALKLNQYKPRE
jgi:hypothetical protein